MHKEDLVNGVHVVKLRNGSYRLVLNGELVSQEGIPVSLVNYSTRLLALGALGESYKGWDIVEVYTITGGHNLDQYLKGYGLELLWKRSEKTPSQLEIEDLKAQIAKLLRQVSVLQSNQEYYLST